MRATGSVERKGEKTCECPCEILAIIDARSILRPFTDRCKQDSTQISEEEFRLYAVCARYPQQLLGKVSAEELQPGLHVCRCGTDAIRIVVLRDLPRVPHNALWHLFSAAPEQVHYGVQEYHQRSEETSTLLHQLFAGYQREGLPMPYTMADFRRDYVKEHLKDLSPEERLKDMSAKERLIGLSLEEFLKEMPPEEIEAYLKRRKANAPPEHKNGNA